MRRGKRQKKDEERCRVMILLNLLVILGDIWRNLTGSLRLKGLLRGAFTDGDDSTVDDESVLCYCGERQMGEYLSSFSSTV